MVGLVPVKTNRMPPMMSTGLPVTVFTVQVGGHRQGVLLAGTKEGEDADQDSEELVTGVHAGLL